MDYKELNDYELVYRIRENSDEDAVELIIKKYEPIICNYAKKFIAFAERNGADLDDLIQEGRVAVAKAIKAYNQDKSSIFYTYVTICIERAFYTYCRNLTYKKNSILNSAINEESVYNYVADGFDLCNHVLNTVSEKDFLLTVKHNFNFLDSSIFELRYNGFSYKEISDLLDISLGVVDSRLCKIRRTLQSNKDKFYI